MDASDDESDGEVLLKEEPGAWIARNPGRLSEVLCLTLELPDHVYSISDSIGDLLNLKHLIIERGINLSYLPHTLPTLLNLVSLQLENCPNLSQFASNFGIKSLPQNLSQLADLTLINCGLESIPSGLRSLTSLSIENCPMEFLAIKESVSLIYVTIKSCNIKSLDGCITGLTKLKHLCIMYCVALEDLPTDINTLVSLETLCIEGCTSIKFLPSLAALHNLYDLSLKGCSSLNELPADFDKLTNLESLYLADTNVQSLPSTIFKLHCLRNLKLPGCFRVETLPHDFDLVGETSECEHVLKSTVVYIQQSFSRNMSLENTASELGGLGNQLEERDRDRHVAGKIAAQSDSNIDARNFVGETINHASENEQLGITTSGCKDGLEPLDHRDLQNVPVKSKRQKGDIPLEDIQQCISRNMTLVNAAKYLDVSRSTLKRRLKELKIEWPSSRKGKQNNSSKKKKKNHNPKSTTVSESLERSSVDGFDRPDQAHASECSDVANQIMLPEFASSDAENTWLEARRQICSGSQGCTHHLSQESGGPSSITHNKSDERLSTDFIKSLMDNSKQLPHIEVLSQIYSDYEVDVGINVIGDTNTLVSQGDKQHLSQESEGPPPVMQNEANKRLYKDLIKSLMDEVSLATLKRYREHNECGVGPSRKAKFSAELGTGSKSSSLVSATTAGTVRQEQAEHLFSSNIPTQRLDGDTINATQQICRDNRERTETSSVEAQDGRTGIIVVKAEYKEHLLRFDFLSTSSVAKLKEEVMKRLPLQEDRMMIKYKDEDNDWVLLACYDDLQHCLRLSISSENKTIRLLIVDS